MKRKVYVACRQRQARHVSDNEEEMHLKDRCTWQEEQVVVTWQLIERVPVGRNIFIPGWFQNYGVSNDFGSSF